MCIFPSRAVVHSLFGLTFALAVPMAMSQSSGYRPPPSGGPPVETLYRPFQDQTVGGSDVGRALVFRRGPLLDQQLSEVCLTFLGTYDPTTGTRTGNSFDPAAGGFVLKGKYVETNVSLNDASPIPRLNTPDNDFRIDPTGAADGQPRESILWSAEAHQYYFITDYRERFANDAFVQSLGLPPAIEQNIRFRQYRPDLQGGTASGKPVFLAAETAGGFYEDSSIDHAANTARMTVRRENVIGTTRYALSFDPDWAIAQYAGLLADWLVAGNQGFPAIPTYGSDLGWRTNISPAIVEGFKIWSAYRYTGNTELFRAAMSTKRAWAGLPCGGTNNFPCDKGWRIDNVMMYLDTADGVLNSPTNPNWPAANSDDTMLFPYRVRPQVPASSNVGPTTNAGLSGMYIAALFYDISHEVGLGDEKADKLFWKTLSLLNPSQPVSMTTFGSLIQQAARALWPDTRPGRAGFSWYEQDLVDVLASRGIRVNGATNFVNLLPTPVGESGNAGPGALLTATGQGIGSAIPESQRNSTTGYNFLTFFINGYQITNPTGIQYVAYQFYKYSKYGPADSLLLTNGTFNTLSSSNPAYNLNGSYYYRAINRELGNQVLLSPGSVLNFMRRRQSAVSEREGYYAEDVRPVGFRVIKAIPNGFTFEVQRLSEDSAHVNYQLSIVDPSVTFAGAASYAWVITQFDGTVVTASGPSVSYAALRDQPVTIRIERSRASVTDVVEMRERGNDLDRSGGKAFARNFASGTYDTGFDTILDRRSVEGHGSYNSALNPVGGAFGVQGRRWVTPSAGPVRPKRFSVVSHGLGSGSNQNGRYRFEDAVYYNACIWDSTATCTTFPGGTNSPPVSWEVQVPFSQVGIDINSPFAIVTAGGYPAFLWSVTLPDTWLLEPNHDYVFGGHVSASVVNNGYSYNVGSYMQAPWDGTTAGNAADRSDWLAGANWSGQSGAPGPQTTRQYLSQSGSVSNYTWSAYKLEAQVLGAP